MTSFRLSADSLDQRFLDKLKSLFAHKEIEIFVRESNEANRSELKADGIRRLLDHPLGIKGFRPPTKDEIYSRD